MPKPYEKLASLYDKNWSQFSLQYLDVLQYLMEKFNFKPKSILDIACGTGVLLGKLSGEYDVMGSDLSEHMIKVARTNYPEIDFIVSNMTDLVMEKRFDLVLCPFDSINYLIEKQDLDQGLKRIYDLLENDGCFLFDFNSESLFTDLHKGSIPRKVNEITFKQILQYDKQTKIAKTIFDFGDGVKEIHVQRAYNYEDIEDSMVNNGFKITYSRDIFNNQEVKPDSYKVLVFAQKKISP